MSLQKQLFRLLMVPFQSPTPENATKQRRLV